LNITFLCLKLKDFEAIELFVISRVVSFLQKFSRWC